MPAFSVIIVNYNGKDFLQGALDSLRAQTFRDFETIVIDNASTDGSTDNLNTVGVPGFRLLLQSENLGFAAANNLGARESKSPWIAMLNPDATAHEDWLGTLEESTRIHPDVSMFACAQLCMENPDMMDGAGDSYLGFGIPWRGGFQRPATDMPEEGECFSPCGASAVFRRKTFLDHGGFDERFFCYCEDVDIGYRLRLAGERCVFLPHAVIRHAGSGISGRASEFSLFHGTRNRLWTYAKNTPPLLLALTLPGHIALTLAILARGLFTGNAGATWRGLKAGIAGLGAIRRDSPYAPPSRKIPLTDLVRMMAWNPKRMLDRRPVIWRSQQKWVQPVPVEQVAPPSE